MVEANEEKNITETRHLDPAKGRMQRTAAPHKANRPKAKAPTGTATARVGDPMDIAAEVAAISGIKGCAYCGGLGHRVTECPKLNSVNERAAKGARDFFGADGFGGET